MPSLRPLLLAWPERLQIVIIVSATVVTAFATALATRTLFDPNQLAADTGLTTSVYEVLGTIYAILLAFVISGIWQNYKAAVASVQAESYALLGIVNTLGAYPAQHTKRIRAMARWPTPRR